MKPSFTYKCMLTLGFLAFLHTSLWAHPEHHDEIETAPQPEFYLITTAIPEAAEKSSVSITKEGEFRVIKSNGWPDHAPGAFPRPGNPNKPTAQTYNFRIPLVPKLAETPERRGGWWWGVALNGVPFEPGTGETWNNDPQSGWRYEAATGFLNLGLDEHNAHVQPNGSYHYHALPKGLLEKLGGDGMSMIQLGWAADGFPIYSAWAYSTAKDAKSKLRPMKSSYQLKKGARPQQENGPGGNYDGRFSQDFEYVPEQGDLDECNGRTGVTPEFPDGTYYYCVTAEFPFVSRLWRGTPDQSFSKGERPPGGGPGGPGGTGGGLRPAPMGGAPRGILRDGPPPAGGGPNHPVIGALDLNKDGAIDAEEISKARESLKTLDKNSDGKLSPEEYRPNFGGFGGGGGPGGPGSQSAPAPKADSSSKPPNAKDSSNGQN
jgi:hypothetical protein